ncbi:LOW QUALITY PROTEIN: hypothetical protein TorRG33x02_267200 [Trema orientale]|uniref:Uncharacterized protein n=1 Tax=Trema orientale TaxID=63057 RepID=A0A2P5D026_TREOI|nr:LOW QUALITY PROTEIN: hypothetical protein TorRG33x02_267200 [Trema orientale]
MMLLTFLDAKKILRQRDRFPNKVLKLSLRFLSLSDPFPRTVSDFELVQGLSTCTDLSPCLGPGTRVGDEEESRKEEALKRCRFRWVVWKEKNTMGLLNEEEETLTGVEVDEDHDHPPLSDWDAMAEAQKESSHALQTRLQSN